METTQGLHVYRGVPWGRMGGWAGDTISQGDGRGFAYFFAKAMTFPCTLFPEQVRLIDRVCKARAWLLPHYAKGMTALMSVRLRRMAEG